jgi:uncharacterized protein (DUF1800 family)
MTRWLFRIATFLAVSIAGAAVTVTLTPASSTLRLGQVQKFDVTVEGATTPYTIVWTVNTIAGGDANVGTISSTGLYTTPAVIPATSNKVTIKAAAFRSSTTPGGAPVQIGSRSAGVTLQNPLPVISQVLPANVPPGPFEVTVNGSGFLPGSKVYFKSTVLTHQFVSPTQLKVTGATTDAQIGHIIPLRVWNPSPGSSYSNIGAFEIHTWTGNVQTTMMDAQRFLRVATWGPTPKSIDRIQKIGVSAFLEEQLNASPSAYPDTLLPKPLEYTQEYFFRLALTGDDQLRQRVAFALSQIFVVSGVEVDCAEAFIPYYRILMNRAFGNFYDLMYDITKNVAMGEYLDMINNKKSANGQMPNENYARELMQLFTIGLYKLNPDGSQQLDSNRNPIPTYGQSEVLELSRVFTGWTYPDKIAGDPTRINPAYYVGPMEPVARYHDTGSKKLLDGYVIPAGLSPEEDLVAALKHIFNHPNIGPFISRQLIQHLVTSSPSPAYVSRVAAVFNNNGQGVRGDLRAVVKAILTDPEWLAFRLGARHDFGKLQEPALFIISMLRALEASVTDHPFMADLSTEMGQRVFYSPSVFNYFSPGYRIPGTAMNAPEFQILSSATSMSRINFVATLITGGFGSAVRIDYSTLNNLAYEPARLLDRINNILGVGKVTTAMRTALLEAVNQSPTNQEKVQTALYLVFASPHYQVDR